MSFLRKGASSTLIPDNQPLNSRQVVNNAGGYSFGVDKWDALLRVLVLGTEGGNFYVGQDKLTERATALIEDCLREDSDRTIAEIALVSNGGRAVKQDYAIYALALALSGDDVTARKRAYESIGLVCRTASTLFQLLSYTKGRRGWSAGYRKAIARWYESRNTDQLAFQLVKYRERSGFTHRDVLRLAHPDDFGDESRHALFQWATNKPHETISIYLPDIVKDFVEAQALAEPDIELVARLPREALPTEWLKEGKVWEALLFGEDGKGMPITALLRNLGNLSKNGALVDDNRRTQSAAVKYVSDVFHDEDRIRKSRVHPIAILLAQSVYAAGRSIKGSGEWAPSRDVTEALDDAFTLAFANVEPTGKRLGVFVDVSGSMKGATVAGTHLSASTVSVAMATVIAQSEPNAIVAGFDYDREHYNRYGYGVNSVELTYHGQGVYPIQIAPRERLKDVIARFNMAGGGTDCSLPLKYLMTKGIDVDAVLIFTDSETWAGQSHAQALLEKYRAKVGHRVKMIVASTTATDLSIGDLADRDVLNVVGFDASVPTVLRQFIA